MDAKTSSEIIPCSLKRTDGRLRAATTQRTSEADLPSRRELATQYRRAAKHLMSARAVFAVLSRSFAASESPSSSHHPRTVANDNSSGLGRFCRFRGPHERHEGKWLGVIRPDTAAWYVALTSRGIRLTEIRVAVAASCQSRAC